MFYFVLFLFYLFLFFSFITMPDSAFSLRGVSTRKELLCNESLSPICSNLSVSLDSAQV